MLFLLLVFVSFVTTLRLSFAFSSAASLCKDYCLCFVWFFIRLSPILYGPIFMSICFWQVYCFINVALLRPCFVDFLFAWIQGIFVLILCYCVIAFIFTPVVWWMLLAVTCNFYYCCYSSFVLCCNCDSPFLLLCCLCFSVIRVFSFCSFFPTPDAC